LERYCRPSRPTIHPNNACRPDPTYKRRAIQHGCMVTKECSKTPYNLCS
jgi:hypothetical protein